jgi:hypothetical protein
VAPLLQASAADAADGTTTTASAANTKPAQYSGMEEAQCRALLEQFKAESTMPFPLKVYGPLQGKPAPAPPAATTATASNGATPSTSAAADSTGSTAGGAAVGGGSGLAAATAAAAAAGGAGAAGGDFGSKRIGAQKTAVPEALMPALLQHVHHSTSNKPQVCVYSEC